MKGGKQPPADEAEYLKWLEQFPIEKKCLSLMGKIATAHSRDKGAPASYWLILAKICEPKRFARFHRKMSKSVQDPEREARRVQKALRKQRRALRAARRAERRAAEIPVASQRERTSAPIRVKVTRTVQYTYDSSDDRRLAEFYASKEWRMIRYEALRLYGHRCQCCGASPKEGARMNAITSSRSEYFGI